jgi:hypothetical protein
MSAARFARVSLRAVTIAAALASATYVVVYLFRWEWHRALMSGVIFVAAELGLLGSMVLRRLGAIEQSLAQRSTALPTGPSLGDHAPVVQPVQAQRPVQRFPWLDPTRMGVFIPVLMGAGAILAGLASVVERAARIVSSRPNKREGIGAGRLGLELPPGGLRATPVAEPGRSPSPGPVHRWARLVLTAVGGGLAAFIALGLVIVLADATKSRPDPARIDLATELRLEVGYHRTDRRSTTASAAALVEACRTTVDASKVISDPVPVDARRVLITVWPSLGRHELRKFRGCLEDLVLDRVSATVSSVSTRPAGPGDGRTPPL